MSGAPEALLAFPAQALAADTAVQLAVDRLAEIGRDLISGQQPSAQDRFAMAALVGNAQRLLRNCADQLGEVAAAVDAALAATSHQKPH